MNLSTVTVGDLLDNYNRRSYVAVLNNGKVVDFTHEKNALLSRDKDGPGYKEIITDVFVREEDAFDYALEQCFEIVPAGVHELRWTEDFREMLVDWFYLGNWIKVSED